MKFQNPSLNFFLNGRKDERTHVRTSRNQYAPHFFKVGCIIITDTACTGFQNSLKHRMYGVICTIPQENPYSYKTRTLWRSISHLHWVN